MNNITQQADSAFFRFIDNHSFLASIFTVATVAAAALYWPIEHEATEANTAVRPASPVQVAVVSPR